MRILNQNRFYLAKYSLIAYIFFISWTSAFALNELLRVHFIVGLAALSASMLACAYRGRISAAPYRVEDFLLVLFLASFSFSGLVNPHASSVNYVVVYFFVIVGLYLTIKGAFYLFLSPHEIYFANLLGIVFVSLFLSTNFILTTTDVIDLQSIIPRLRNPTATYRGLYIRGYGFSTEPGIVAYYINTLGPLGLWYLWFQTKTLLVIRLLLTWVVIFGWVVTFSAGGSASLLVGLLVTYLILSIKTKWLLLKAARIRTAATIFISIVSGLVLTITFELYKFFTPILDKLTLTGDLKTVSTRIDRLSAGIASLKNGSLFGKGPGFFSSTDGVSPINWFLMVLAENGIISLILVVLFLFIVFMRITNFRHSSRFAVLTGFLAGCCHLMITTTSGYLHPFIWLLIGIFYSQMALSKQSVGPNDVKSEKCM